MSDFRCGFCWSIAQMPFSATRQQRINNGPDRSSFQNPNSQGCQYVCHLDNVGAENCVGCKLAMTLELRCVPPLWPTVALVKCWIKQIHSINVIIIHFGNSMNKCTVVMHRGIFKGRVSRICLLPFVNTTFKLGPPPGSTHQRYRNVACSTCTVILLT